MLFEQYSSAEWESVLRVLADEAEEQSGLPLAESFRRWAEFFRPEVLKYLYQPRPKDVFGFYSPIGLIKSAGALCFINLGVLARGLPYICDCSTAPHYPHSHEDCPSDRGRILLGSNPCREGCSPKDQSDCPNCYWEPDPYIRGIDREVECNRHRPFTDWGYGYG